MGAYFLRRLILFPVTLFAILLLNFIIINLMPGDPIDIINISESGAEMRAGRTASFAGEERYLQFREHFGLTLPLLFNTWPWITKEETLSNLNKLLDEKSFSSLKDKRDFQRRVGDQARFTMPYLADIMTDPNATPALANLAASFFIRGASRTTIAGPFLTKAIKKENRIIADERLFLKKETILANDSEEAAKKKREALYQFWLKIKPLHPPTFMEKIDMFFFETRFFRYFKKVLSLDFGTMRNDANRLVIKEVGKRMKYSITLSFLPLFITFFLCIFIGAVFSTLHGNWIEKGGNVFFLILYAIPIFVAVPFLIEQVALKWTFPWDGHPVPLHGFTSKEAVYEKMTSLERFIDVLEHLFLPLTALAYATFASGARLAKSTFLEALRQDYFRAARARGLSYTRAFFSHVVPNAAIPLITSLAGALGAVLGGSVIVETMFEIDGFGRFFYEAALNRDYNVLLFSAIAGSFLALVGYLIADFAYMFIDPRVEL